MYLFDIVFSSGDPDLPTSIDDWIKAVETMADARLAQEAVIHVHDEFSTCDWIMEGIIRSSSFRIDSAEYGQGFQTTNVCTQQLL